jgi:hypothetical protein
LLPGAAIGTAVENGVYNARRGRVKSCLAANHAAILADIRTGSGPALSAAMDLARVTGGQQGQGGKQENFHPGPP